MDAMTRRALFPLGPSPRNQWHVGETQVDLVRSPKTPRPLELAAGQRRVTIDPGVNCTQISGSLERDVDAAVSAVARHTGSNPDEEILREHYSEAALRERLAVLVKELESLDLRAEAGVRPPVIAPDHEVFSRQQQEIAVLKEQVRYHDNAVTIHRQGIDWLRGELSSRDTAIATLQEAIDWLKGEVAERERIMAAQQRPRAGSRPHDPANRTYRLYQRALNRYRRSGPVVRFVFERLIQAAVSPLSRWRGVRFPSRAIGGWWSIWRWTRRAAPTEARTSAATYLDKAAAHRSHLNRSL